jgi:hypothetical protein
MKEEREREREQREENIRVDLMEDEVKPTSLHNIHTVSFLNVFLK